MLLMYSLVAKDVAAAHCVDLQFEYVLFTKEVEEVRYSKPRSRTDFFFFLLNVGFIAVLVMWIIITRQPEILFYFLLLF